MFSPDFSLADNLFLPARSSNLIGKKRSKVLEAPVIILDKKYEDNPGKFLDYIQSVSDYMPINGAGLYDETNPNHEGLFDVELSPTHYLPVRR